MDLKVLGMIPPRRETVYFFEYDSWIKGLEWPWFCTGLTDGLLPAGFLFRNSFGDNDENLNEEMCFMWLSLGQSFIVHFILY